MNFISTGSFLAFIVLGLVVIAAEVLQIDERRQRLLTNCLLVFTLFVSFATGLSQHDAWPFSSWTMMVGLTPPATRTIPTLRIVGVDAAGDEHDIDYRTWQPLSLEELHAWLKATFRRLDPAAKQRVAAYLVSRANCAREQALSNKGLAYPNRWLGRLNAPTHLLHPAIWSDPKRVPQTAFVGLRIYEESWPLEIAGRDSHFITRVLQYDYLPR